MRKLRVVLRPAGSESVRVRAARTTFQPAGYRSCTVPSMIGRFPWLTKRALAVNVVPGLTVEGAARVA